MKAYEGLLRGGSGRGSWPRSWLVLTVQPSLSAQSGSPRLRSSGLASWCAELLERTSKGLRTVRVVDGFAATEFWNLLSGWLPAGEPHWIIGEYGVREWTLLGLWQQLLLGRIEVADTGPIRRRVEHDKGMGREPGMFMTADPPTAGRFRISEGGGIFTWVSARNYGRMPEPDSVPLVERCSRLAGWCCRIDAALHDIDIPGWKPTLGGMAWIGWRKTYAGEPLYRSRSSAVVQLEKAARAGGIIRPAPKGRVWERCYHLDARGLYSFIAAHYDLPTGVDAVDTEGRIGVDQPDGPIGVALSSVELKAGCGRFPVRGSHGVRYPAGPCNAVLASPELCAAVRMGLVARVKQTVLYTLDEPLAAFEKRLYSFRCQAESAGDKDLAALAKGLGVAIIGKFAGRAELWEECSPDYNDPLFGRWWGQDEKGRAVVYEATPAGVARCRFVGDSWNSLPAVALWIWSAGRCWMWERIDAAGTDNVIYCHTDGIIVTEEGALRLEEKGLIKDQVWGQLRRLSGPVRVESRRDGILDVGCRLIAPGVPLRDRDALEELGGGNWFRLPPGSAPAEYLSGRLPESTRRTHDEGVSNDD